MAVVLGVLLHQVHQDLPKSTPALAMDVGSSDRWGVHDRPTGTGVGTGSAAGSPGSAGAGSLSRLSSRALTATSKLEPDMDRAAISGRSTRPIDGSNTPAAMGSAMAL